METVVRGMPLEYPPKPERLNAYGNGRWGGKRTGTGESGSGGEAEADAPGEDVTLSVDTVCPCFCLHLFLTLTLSLPIPVTLCLDLPGSGPAGAEREVVVNMLNSLSRNQPQITPRCGCADPLPGRLPFQGYESACSGRHYCLRGMDYYATGLPGTERRLRPPCAQQPTVRFAGHTWFLSRGPPRPQTSPAPVSARALRRASGRAHLQAPPCPVTPPSSIRLLGLVRAGPRAPGQEQTAERESLRDFPEFPTLSQGQPGSYIWSGGPAGQCSFVCGRNPAHQSHPLPTLADPLPT